MKKILRLTATILAVVTTISGCSFGNSDASEINDVDAQSITDLYLNATKAVKVENSEAFNVYMDGCEKIEGADSITITSDMYIGMGIIPNVGTQNETSENTGSASSSLVEIKRQLVEDSYKVNLEMSNVYDNEPRSSVEGYFADGYLYFVSDEDKIKEAMAYEDLMSMIGNYAYTIEEEMIAEAAVVADGDDSIYFFDLDDIQMAQMMESNLTASGIQFTENDYVETEYASMEARVNKEGIISAFKLSIKAIVHDSNGDTPVIYNIDSKFTDINNTIVSTPEDLDSYMDADEYMKKLQKEAEAIEEAEAMQETTTVNMATE